MDTLQAQIRVTKGLIATQGQDIALNRVVTGWTKTTSGGQRATKDASNMQPAKRRFFAFVPVRGGTGSGGPISRQDELRPNRQGEKADLHAVLVGPPGDDIRKGDEFTVNNLLFKVEYVHQTTLPYETRAEVISYAS